MGRTLYVWRACCDGTRARSPTGVSRWDGVERIPSAGRGVCDPERDPERAPERSRARDDRAGRGGAGGGPRPARTALFRIQVADERFTVPAQAPLSIEHEAEGGQEELELQPRWTTAPWRRPLTRREQTTRRADASTP